MTCYAVACPPMLSESTCWDPLEAIVAPGEGSMLGGLVSTVVAPIRRTDLDVCVTDLRDRKTLIGPIPPTLGSGLDAHC